MARVKKVKNPRTVRVEPELSGMPPVDPEVAAARKYMNSIGDLATAEEAVDVAAGEFMASMRSRNRDRLEVDGKMLVIQNKPANDAEQVIVVRKVRHQS